MVFFGKQLISAGLTLALAFTSAPAFLGFQPAQASEIKYVVNDVPVTSYDIQRRGALLKLQRQSTSGAAESMIEQVLRAVEMKRLNIEISDQAVEDAYARFAQNNKISTAQLDQILTQAGVTRDHFKDYIRVQMGWDQALGARFRATSQMSEQDMVRQMLKKGGEKPSAMEYMLQQVIFVIPDAERSALLAKRKREAQAMSDRFNGCDTTQEFAKGLLDVTVRDPRRFLAPELPPEWADAIKATQPGDATGVKETELGVEFIGICSAREVSDDRVAQMLLQTGDEDAMNEKAKDLNDKYLAELRERARIVER